MAEGARISRQQYFAIREALSKKEKELIDYYEIQWHLRHHVPTTTDVAGYLKIPETSVNYYLLRKQVVKALDSRGIPWRQHSQVELTSTQVACAVTLMNFADTRSNEDKLDQLGINPTQYYAWLKDPAFKNLIDSLADQNLTNIRPTAIGELTKKINSGDWNAIRFFLETTGELQQDQPQSEALLKMIIEVIQRHVKDPETIIAIAQDIKLAAANRTLDVVKSPPQITSYVVPEEDQELQEAKKLIGFG